MKWIRITAKSVVTQYGSWSRNQEVPVSDEFALHMIENKLAEEVSALEQPEAFNPPAPFNKMLTPSQNPEKKAPLLNTGESSQYGEEKPSASSAAALDLSQRPRKPFAGRK